MLKSEITSEGSEARSLCSGSSHSLLHSLYKAINLKFFLSWKSRVFNSMKVMEYIQLISQCLPDWCYIDEMSVH